MQHAGRLARYLLAALVTAGLLGACAAPSRIGGGPALDPAGRRAAIVSVGTWEARGRIALKTPGTSGQGNFAWLQTGDRTVLRVAGPFGAGAYEIRWEPERLTVLSGRGEVAADYTGPDAARRFLEEQLGWSLPVANARYWLLGLAGPDTSALETLDDSGLLAALVQDGWDVSYGEYRPEGAIALPRKLVLSGTAGRIRLVIDHWEFGSRDF
ncbi:MAG: outer membrane lipoprotein LolB [Chromatiales bacterium]|nr:outer membrane lipoprotein LolB [Chromatiales bacterium]